MEHGISITDLLIRLSLLRHGRRRGMILEARHPEFSAKQSRSQGERRITPRLTGCGPQKSINFFAAQFVTNLFEGPEVQVSAARNVADSNGLRAGRNLCAPQPFDVER